VAPPPWSRTESKGVSGQCREEHIDGLKALEATSYSLGLDHFSFLF
jgi:hypothetical protein